MLPRAETGSHASGPSWHHRGVKTAAKPIAKTKSTTKAKSQASAKPKSKPPAKSNPKTPTAKALPSGRPAASASRKFPTRADLGAPVDGFFAKQPPILRPILDELRKLVDEVAPDASSSIKWGMPFYTLGGNTLCALAGFKAHVNLILPGPPGTYADPRGLLEGDGKTGKHLKLRSLEELPRAEVRAWLRLAADRARSS